MNPVRTFQRGPSFLHTKGMQALGAGVIGLYLDLALRTARWRIEADPETWDLLVGQTGETVIVVFWHEFLPLVAPLWWRARRDNPRLTLHALISRHRDGRLIAGIMRRWDVQSVDGSSGKPGKPDKGGAAALRGMLRLLRQGGIVSLTPDGPRGPRRVMQPGTAQLAAMSGVRVIPLAVRCNPEIRIPSWDRMQLPLPFSRLVLRCGTPIAIARGEQEAGTARISRALETLHPPEALPARRRSGRIISASLWHLTGTLAEPAVRLLLHRRLVRGKERADRLPERRGLPSLARPDGRLIWLHAASVGETVSVLTLVEALCALDPTLIILMTTGSITSQQLLARRLQASGLDGRVLHQFVPFDIPRWWRRFFDHWRPAALALVESELWPNLIGAAAARRVPMALVNARLSERSYRGWTRLPGLARWMLLQFAWITARSAEDADRLRALGAVSVDTPGDLKAAAAPLPADAVALVHLQAMLGARPIFLAACTHAGEETVIADVQRLLTARFPASLTIVAPRHPERGEAIAAQLGTVGGPAPRRALGQHPGPSDPIWVFDTLGEMGLLYRLARIAFVGNSLAAGQAPGGGHNPFEPTRLGCVVCIGPRNFNFNDAVGDLKASDAIVVTPDAAAIADWASRMLDDPEARARKARAGQEVATRTEDLAPALARRLLDLIEASEA